MLYETAKESGAIRSNKLVELVLLYLRSHKRPFQQRTPWDLGSNPSGAIFLLVGLRLRNPTREGQDERPTGEGGALRGSGVGLFLIMPELISENI